MSSEKGNSLLIIGAGGYGRLVKEIAQKVGYKEIEFLDDNNPNAIGPVNEIEKYKEKFDECIIAIGNAQIRENISCRVSNLATLVHPTAVVSESATIKKGCVIEANAVVNTEATINECTFICAGAVVNHNAKIDGFCQIDCNSVVSAGKTVLKGTKVNSCTVF